MNKENKKGVQILSSVNLLLSLTCFLVFILGVFVYYFEAPVLLNAPIILGNVTTFGSCFGPLTPVDCEKGIDLKDSNVSLDSLKCCVDIPYECSIRVDVCDVESNSKAFCCKEVRLTQNLFYGGWGGIYSDYQGPCFKWKSGPECDLQITMAAQSMFLIALLAQFFAMSLTIFIVCARCDRFRNFHEKLHLPCTILNVISMIAQIVFLALIGDDYAELSYNIGIFLFWLSFILTVIIVILNILTILQLKKQPPPPSPFAFELLKYTSFEQQYLAGVFFTGFSALLSSSQVLLVYSDIAILSLLWLTSFTIALIASFQARDKEPYALAGIMTSTMTLLASLISINDLKNENIYYIGYGICQIILSVVCIGLFANAHHEFARRREIKFHSAFGKDNASGIPDVIVAAVSFVFISLCLASASLVSAFSENNEFHGATMIFVRFSMCMFSFIFGILTLQYGLKLRSSVSTVVSAIFCFFAFFFGILAGVFCNEPINLGLNFAGSFFSLLGFVLLINSITMFRTIEVEQKQQLLLNTANEDQAGFEDVEGQQNRPRKSGILLWLDKILDLIYLCIRFVI